MRRGDPMPSHYCNNSIGCQSSSRPHTSWQLWRKRFGPGPLPFTCTTKSRNVSAAELFTFICHPAAGPTVYLDRLFQACFPMFSTVCLEQTVLISDFLSVLNLDLKLFYSIRLSLNTDPTCRRRLWSYDCMALYKFDYYYYYYFLQVQLTKLSRVLEIAWQSMRRVMEDILSILSTQKSVYTYGVCPVLNSWDNF